MTNPGAGYPITIGSFPVNDQLLTAPAGSFFNPNNVTGPVFMGGARGLQTIPQGIGATDIGPAAGGGPGAGAAAGASPWSPTQSPLPLLIGMLIFGMLILRYVHWRG